METRVLAIAVGHEEDMSYCYGEALLLVEMTTSKNLLTLISRAPDTFSLFISLTIFGVFVLLDALVSS